jgi:hypothetical protein
MGVISEADKKILLERLAKAREAKAAKKKALSAPVAAPVPDVAPLAPVAPVPAAPAPAVDDQPICLVSPPVPDLVAAAAALSAKKPKQKKVKLPESSSDSDDDPVLPPKKQKGTKRSGAPYMKIKIYKESPKALESIMQTIQDNQQEEDEAPLSLMDPSEPPISIPPSALSVAAARPRTVCMTGTRPSTNTQVLRAGSLRDAALAFFS